MWKTALAVAALGACTGSAPAAPHPSATGNAPAKAQRAGGQPYEILGTQVWDVPDPVSHRTYQVFVSLPANYDHEAGHRFPVLYVTDADYAFPVVKQVARRLNGEGPKIKDFILVGLSYAVGEDGTMSRRRDYTPTAGGPTDAPPGTVYGGGTAYESYLRRQVIPFIAGRYRTDEGSRYFLGHSLGGLLGAQILFSDPGMFRGYILGSPSLWFDHRVIFRSERAYALHHHDLPASVYLYVGEYEDIRHGDGPMVNDVKTFARTLQERHYPSLHLEAEILNDEDHLSVAPRGATHGLKRLLAVR